MHEKTKAYVCLACLAPMLWGVHPEEEGLIPSSGQIVALPPQTHQPETHAEFEFSYIPGALTEASGNVTVAPPSGSIVFSGFAPTNRRGPASATCPT